MELETSNRNVQNVKATVTQWFRDQKQPASKQDLVNIMHDVKSKLAIELTILRAHLAEMPTVEHENNWVTLHDDTYTVYLIAWPRGSHTPIHDHAYSVAHVDFLQGTITETV